MKVLIATPAAPQLRTLPVGLASLQGEFGTSTPWATMLSGAMLTTIPMAIMFFVFQKHFHQGLSSGAVVGRGRRARSSGAVKGRGQGLSSARSISYN